MDTKIALGTVQFGLDYGINNKTGQISTVEAAAILEYALNNGIDTLDTAVGYGSSEGIIGSIIADKQYRFDIVSKFPSGVTAERFNDVLNGSLQRLNAKCLKGYLAHGFDAFKHKSIRQCLNEAKEQGLVQKVGVSVYYPEEVSWLLEETIEFDIIQLPFNIFDQRFRPLFTELKARDIEIHARSVFLQGLFFMDIDEVPQHFESIRDMLIELHQLAERAAVPLSALLLNHAVTQEEIDKVVIGVAGLTEVQENIGAYAHMEQSRRVFGELDAFAISDEQIVLPFNWS